VWFEDVYVSKENASRSAAINRYLLLQLDVFSEEFTNLVGGN
jgi:hypothetical protein